MQYAAEHAIPVLLVGYEVPENFGPDYKREFEAIYPELAEQYSTLFFERYFAPLETAGDRGLARMEFMQDDGLHPNAKGVRLIVESMGPVVLELIKLTGKDC